MVENEEKDRDYLLKQLKGTSICLETRHNNPSLKEDYEHQCFLSYGLLMTFSLLKNSILRFYSHSQPYFQDILA